MGWLIALAILFLLGCLPLGIKLLYDVPGFSAEILIGPVKIPVFPLKKKDKNKPVKEKTKQDASAKATGTEEKKGAGLADFFPLVRIAMGFLGNLRRKLRVNRLEMLLCMAGDDPCDLAVNYGKAWAAVGNIMPQLERLFTIRKRDVQVRCDFTSSQTTLYLRADITITLGRLLGLLLRYGWLAVKQYLKIIDKRKGGALK